MQQGKPSGEIRSKDQAEPKIQSPGSPRDNEATKRKAMHQERLPRIKESGPLALFRRRRLTAGLTRSRIGVCESVAGHH